MTVLKPLSELVRFKGGGTPSKQIPEYWGGDIPWASVKDFTSTSLENTQDFITQDGLENSSANLIPKGHVIIPTRMALGKAAINTVDLAINQDLRALVPIVPLNAEYLLHAFLSLKDEIIKKGSGATVKGITQEELYKMEIPYPSLEDQIRIAHLLGKVEALITQRKQHLQQLDDLLKSVFLEMFGDPVRNEKGWSVDRIGKSIKVQGGFAFKSKDISSSSSIKLVKIANVHFENLTWDEVSSVPESFLSAYEKFSLHEGDLLIALTRPVIKSLNVVKTATVRQEDLPCLLNQRVARFLIDHTRINKRFFLQYCYTEFFRATVDGLCPPGLQPNISTNQIEDIPIFYPPMRLQHEFAAITEKVERIKYQYKQSLADIEVLYRVLSQQAFKGELDLARVLPPAAYETMPNEINSERPPQLDQVEISLPETDLLNAALVDREKLKLLLAFWLQAYVQQLDNKLFTVDEFIRMAELSAEKTFPDGEFEFGADAYDLIKSWVFQELSAGRLEQIYLSADIRVALRKSCSVTEEQAR